MMRKIFFVLSMLLACCSAFLAVTTVAFDQSSPEKIQRIIFWGLGFALFASLAYFTKGHRRSHSPLKNGLERVSLNEADMAACRTLEEGPDAALAAMREIPAIRDAQDPEEALRRAVHHAVPALVKKALEDHILTKEEERAIAGLFVQAGLPVTSMDAPARERLLKAAVVRDLLSSDVHPRFSASDIPFNLQKTEIPVWCWSNVHMLRDKTVSEWQGRSSGVSIRIMSGLYWRIGASKGEKVSYKVKESLGYGPLAVTSRHLYFQGTGAAVRIRHDKIISMRPYDDGVTIYPDGIRAKPLTIMTNDAWFLINCLSNAQNWAGDNKRSQGRFFS